MSDFRPRELIREAKESLQASSCNPQKWTLLHTGITIAAGLLVTLLSYLLSIGIGSTGGLSGIGNRAALVTAQTVVEALVSILSPFWAIGFVAAALRLARRQEVNGHTLLTGLYRWGPALRLLLLQGLIYFAVAMVGCQIGSILFALSPAASQLETLVSDLMANVGDTAALEEILAQLTRDDLVHLLLQMLPFYLIPLALLLIPVTYRMRLAQYILTEDQRCGALFAIVGSFRLSKGHCCELFRLDLRYWWYYVLEVLALVLTFGDLLLGLESDTASLVFYVLGLAAQLALYAWKKAQVFTTYGLFYDRLLPQEQVQL